MVGYNVQSAVDTKHHLIVEHEVTNVGSDRSQLSRMTERARAAIGSEAIEAVADRGYYSGEEILACEEAGISVYLPKPMTSGINAKGRLASRTLSMSPRTTFIFAPPVNGYPLLQDETCWFLVADFDKDSWADDARALLDICRAKGITAALERSRSRNGGHVWILFSEPVPARTARQMGSAPITETIEKRPEIGFTSYDRLFPIKIRCPSEALAI
jgi:hypothetical protein